jgi:hypothetical protein
MKNIFLHKWCAMKFHVMADIPLNKALQYIC